MIRIQKTKNILGILFFSLLSVSCQEWLDVSPSTEVKYDDLFSYKNGFKDQLTGVYTALCSEELVLISVSECWTLWDNNISGIRKPELIITCIVLFMTIRKAKK